MFYGWTLVGVGFVAYGLGVAPGYYSWGFLAPELMDELGLTREQIGSIFGTFTLTLATVSPLAAIAIRRFGLRATISAGALCAGVGFWCVSLVDSLEGLYLSYALVAGIGFGFSTLLPFQALPVNWFRRYRARATAVILLGAAVFGAAVTPIDALILEHWDWRIAFRLIAGSSIFVALIALVLIRNHPGDIGQRRDGRLASEEAHRYDPTEPATAPVRLQWTVVQAIRTPHFLVATFAGLTNAVPWRVLTAHGRLHFEDLGFTPTAAAAILGVRVGVSAVGRLSASLGDFMRPTRVLAMALTISGLGLLGLLFATSALYAYPCVLMLGVGYGLAFVSEPIVFADFFGRNAFVGTGGLRIAITGVAGWIAPTWAGASADKSGSYVGAITVLMLMAFAGATAIFFCPRPQLHLRS